MSIPVRAVPTHTRMKFLYGKDRSRFLGERVGRGMKFPESLIARRLKAADALKESKREHNSIVVCRVLGNV